MATILFIGHEASRTGAPFTQLHLMRWLKANTNHKMVLALLAGGERALLKEFEELADVYIVDSPTFPLSARIWSKLNRMAGKQHSNTINSIVKHAPELIFVNTLIAINYGVMIKEKTNSKLICNIHELDTYALFYAPVGGYLPALKKADWLMMGSKAVKNFYLNNFDIDSANVSVIYDFIADETVNSEPVADIKALYNIPRSAKLVGGIGTLDWRKGKEIFLYVAREVVKHSSDAYFIWVGGKKSSVDYKQMEREVKLLGLEDRIILTGEQTDIRSYYEAFNIFLLTSREDPFPLVCLESALATTPVICFEGSGGMPEFVRDDAGYVIPYVDISQMAEKTLLLLNDEPLRKSMGSTARNRVLNNHVISKIGPSVLKLIEEVL
ncbi:MAG TPA: glycosyltransferase family 4 protein [Hymenobacter sp.]|jgi:glycosyltransferase involved in cell wall biosynthesis|uniref:glycosyltransferase family 4 protein n=1 Tax=Hymenobacter sp. TaxID=1898978 RepID=UPI002EDAD3FB